MFRNVRKIISRFVSRQAGALPRCPSLVWLATRRSGAPCTASRRTRPNREIISRTFLNATHLFRRKTLFVPIIVFTLGLASFSAFAGAYDDFFLAVKTNQAEKVKSLLARGLDPNLIEEERGDNGLILALREDAMKVFDVLVEAPGIDVDMKSKNGDNALMIASYKGSKHAVEALLAKGSEVNRPGWTALHYAAAAGDNEIVKMLLDKSAYIDAESPNKTTPLMMAAREGHIYTVKLLLDEGADATLKNDLGMNAIDFAEKHNHKDIAEGLAYRLKKAGKL